MKKAIYDEKPTTNVQIRTVVFVIHYCDLGCSLRFLLVLREICLTSLSLSSAGSVSGRLPDVPGRLQHWRLAACGGWRKFGLEGAFRVLALDDELFGPDAYHLADRWLECVRGDGVIPEIGQSGGAIAEGHLVIEQAGGGGDELE